MKYQNGTAAFSLIVTEIPTQLKTESGLTFGSVYFPKTHYVTLIFERTDLAVNITGATIEITNVEGLEYSIREQEGVYILSITPSVVGKWSLTIRASLNQYRNASVIYEFEVEINPSVIEGDGPPVMQYYNQTYFFVLWYGSNGVGIQNSIVNVTYNPIGIIHFTEIEDGFYNFSMRGAALGDYAISIRFSKYGFAESDRTLGYEIVKIPTTLSIVELPEVFYEMRTYSIQLYLNSTVTNGVAGATLVPSVNVRDFFVLGSCEGGLYRCSLTPIMGQWNVTLWLVKEGYSDQVISFTMDVELIPMVLSSESSLNSTIIGIPGDDVLLRLQFLAGDTGQVITGATVRFTMFIIDNIENEIVSQGQFQETSGVYVFTLILPEPGLYVMNITIDKVSYEATFYDVVINSEEDPSVVFASLIQSGILGALSLFGIISFVYVSRVIYSRQSTKWRLELLDLQGRLEDARNLIGLLVIHNTVGLPLYSKIIKGGFQESMVSSFITAITHFRSEFKWDGPIYAAIPITEVITAVQTKSLICAIITVDAPTESQKRKLEEFGMAVSETFDEDTLSHMITSLDAFSENFDPLFDKYFDGRILKRYVDLKDSVQHEHLDSLKVIRSEFDIEKGSSADDLIKNLIRRGYGERRAHKIILEAIDDEILIPHIENLLEEPT